jgi:hypothetical protein
MISPPEFPLSSAHFDTPMKGILKLMALCRKQFSGMSK